jgi:ABC-type nitrate/sulfonate/bicarbonate transport system substrate-binding protein
MHAKRKLLGGSFLALTLALGISTSAGAYKIPPTPATPLSITIGTNSITAGSAQVVIAEQLGFFKQANLTVKYITPLGSGSDNALVSGQVDLVLDGLSELPLLGALGQNPVAIRGTAEVGRAAFFAGSPGTTLASLKAKAGNCSIGTLGPGSLTYGYTTFYNNHLGLKCDIVPMSTASVIIAAAVTGRVDAIGQSQDALIAALQAGQVTTLIDPSKPADRATAGLPDIPESAWVGMAPNLQAKKEAVIRFLQVMDRVDRWEELFYNKPDTIANVIVKDSNYTAVTEPILATQVTNGLPFLLPNKLFTTDGVLSQATWNSWLNFQNAWNIAGFDPSASYNAYNQRIDMSYLIAARKGEGLTLVPPKSQFVSVDKTHNTLRAIAAWKLGDASKWKAVYGLNSTFFIAHHVPRSKLSTYKLPVGLKLAYT